MKPQPIIDPEVSALRGEVESLSLQLAQSYEELSLVYDLGNRMTVDRSVTDFLELACAQAIEAMTVRAAGAFIWDERLGDIPPTFVGDINLEADELRRLNEVLRGMLLDGTIDCEEGADGRFFRSNTLAEIESLAWLAPRVTQLLAVPMRRQGTTVGCCFAFDKDVPEAIFGTYNDGVFTSVERKLLAGVAVHVGIFLDNHRLFAEAEQLMMGLLHSLVAAVDAKDAYTRGHSVRVALFAKRLAEEAGFDEHFCERVYLSGLLHDVGKIGVEDAVLRKPGKLTDDEFGQIKRHPEIGHRILQRVPRIQDILPGVLHHHEKYDGRGYPGALAGEDIPLLGRLMCIADSFDAMTSSRTYRKAMPIEVALAEINRCKGTQFDPILADLFCNIPLSDFEAMVELERGGGLSGVVMSGPFRTAA